MTYLDNAATTFPKPARVIKAMERCMKFYGGNPGRSSHRLALAAAEAVFDTRSEIAELFGISKPENVIFTQNATHALNKVLRGMITPRSHVIISNLEHNSVYRPVRAICEAVGARYDIVDATKSDDELISEIKSRIVPASTIVVMLHASNICSRVLPIKRIGAVCRENGADYVLDASQSAGIYDIDVVRDGITVVCAPGHKGLFGPQGTGFAAFCDGFDFSRLTPSEFGGNGMNSSEPYMGSVPPESYEAGTVNVPGIVGLGEGVRYVKAIGTENILRHERELFAAARDGLSALGARVLLPECEGGVLLFNVGGRTGSGFSSALADMGVCTRAGLHCAPLAHEALGTGGDGVRVSFSALSSADDVTRLCSAAEKIISEN